MGEVVMNDDLLVEIFLRASGVCIFRLKCLSRQWNRYLSSPLFRQKYLSRRKKHELETIHILGCFRRTYYNTMETPASFHPIIESLGSEVVGASSCINNLGSFVACSNGLVLLRSCNNTNNYYVCNPFTDKAIELPTPNRIDQPEPLITSFHYHEEDEEECARFRVVRTCPNQGYVPSSSVSIEIYSSETGVWKESTLTGPEPFLILWASEASCSKRRDMVYWQADPSVIVAYDPKATHDCVWLIQLPLLALPVQAMMFESDEGLLMCAVHHHPGLLTVKILPKRLHDYSYATVVPASEWSPYFHSRFSLSPLTYPHLPPPGLLASTGTRLLVIENGFLYFVHLPPMEYGIYPCARVPKDYDAPFFLWNWPWPPSIPSSQAAGE